MGVAAVAIPGVALGAAISSIETCAGAMIGLIKSVIKDMQDRANKHM